MVITPIIRVDYVLFEQLWTLSVRTFILKVVHLELGVFLLSGKHPLLRLEVQIIKELVPGLAQL